MAHPEREAEEKDNELEAANRELQRMSDQLYGIEDQNERLKQEMDRLQEDEGVERDRLEQLAAALKQVHPGGEAQMIALMVLYRKLRR